MADVNPFLTPGSWYKGALHVHTTRSDGSLTPNQSIEFHRDHGYHFLSVTDHDVITDLSAQSTPEFLNIPGVEVTHGHNELGQSYHIVLIGIRRMSRPANVLPIQQAIDQWAEQAQIRFLAHPYWSGMVLSEMMPLEKLDGLEIYNTSSWTDLGKGLATVLWDELLVRGKHWWGFAVDDTHGINDDAAGGWVQVKSEKLDEPSIITAMRNGAFYSSSGPDIYDFRIEKGVVSLRCSPVATINFMGHTQWGFQRRAEPGKTITEAQWRLTGHEHYLRAECIEGSGHAAWTNPIVLG
jgi:hypothetical protein